MTRIRANVLGVFLAAAAFVASALISSVVFERIPHLEDEFALLWQADVMADGAMSTPSPEFPDSFMIPFVIDANGIRFGKYPPGWPAALSLGARVGEAWLVQALLSAASVWLLFRLGQKLLDTPTGLLAGALALFSPFFLLQSGSLLAHMFSLFLTLAFVHAWLDLFLRTGGSNVPKIILVLVAGLSLGLLALTRPWTALAVAAPFGIHAVVLLCKGLRRNLWTLVALGLLAAAVAALLFAWQAALTGNAFQEAYSLWWEYDLVGFGPGHGPVEGGHSLNLAWFNTLFSLQIASHDVFGWPYLSWLFLPVGFWALRRKPGAWLVFAILPSLILFYLAYWTGAWLFGPRYYFEAMPALVVGTAAGLRELQRLIQQQGWRRWLGKAGVWLAGVLVAGNLIFYLPLRLRGMYALYGIQRSHIQAVLELNLEPGLLIVHSARWMPYANLALLAPPFSDYGFDVALNQGSETDAVLASGYHANGEQVYHYYPDHPDSFRIELPADGDVNAVDEYDR